MSSALGFRFPAWLHVRTGREFQRIYRLGGRARGKHLHVVVLQNGLDHSRLGLSVSKRNGNAVRRNRIKRMTREAYRLTRWEIEAKAGFVDIVVIPGHPEGHYPLEELIAEFADLVAAAAARARKPKRRHRPARRPS